MAFERLLCSNECPRIQIPALKRVTLLFISVTVHCYLSDVPQGFLWVSFGSEEVQLALEQKRRSVMSSSPPKHPGHGVHLLTHPSAHICHNTCAPPPPYLSFILTGWFHVFLSPFCFAACCTTGLCLVCVFLASLQTWPAPYPLYIKAIPQTDPQPRPILWPQPCFVACGSPVAPVGTIPISLLFNLDKNLSCSMWEINIQ